MTTPAPLLSPVDGFDPAREKILEQSLGLALFDGWVPRVLDEAARAAGVDRATARAAFPGGVRDLLRYWSSVLDAEMRAVMAAPEFADQRIRDKVSGAVKARLAAMGPHKESARRAAALLATPPFAPLGARLTWATADAIWRGLGDGSTDFNFYTKRASLSAVLTSTTARWLADDSEDEAATDAFLAARIENVMQFEKAKAEVRKIGLDPTRPIGWLAKLRYPAARP